ncbi:hypothetical protein [Legionella feeleii]|uniref:hypothetical protein n=1 Tax=Legionella feeleii TaxID=453 RepID=UPI000E0E891F|nr:hypothetical protein [Legionella feeleii]
MQKRSVNPPVHKDSSTVWTKSTWVHLQQKLHPIRDEMTCQKALFYSIPPISQPLSKLDQIVKEIAVASFLP